MDLVLLGLAGPTDDGTEALVCRRDETFCHGKGGRKFWNLICVSMPDSEDDEGEEDDYQDTTDEVGDSEP